MEVVLASASPRRKMLLQAAGLDVEVRPQNVDESPLKSESVEQQVIRLAEVKMQCCHEENMPIIAADTLVALHGIAFGQPESLADAKKMLQQLSGQAHQVYSAVSVRYQKNTQSAVVSTRVQFRKLHDAEIDTYLLYNEVLDKAGAYAIQGGGAGFITAIDGPLDSVMGLPVHRTLELLAEVAQ
ncbi:MAG: Maf family protein [Mariprofundaceae bacterium]